MKFWQTLRETTQKWWSDFARKKPARFTLLVFFCIIVLVTGLLMLPISTAGSRPASFVDALFNGTSAVCVTGLTTVPTDSYWSTFGLVVLMFGIKIGGLGVMTLASILSLAVSRHIGLSARILAAGEKNSKLGEVGSLIKMVVLVSITVELSMAVLFFPQFMAMKYGIGQSAWYAIFMAISVFNNCGMVVIPGGMQQFASNFGIFFPLTVGAAIGALGFPVALDVARNWKHPRKFSLHTKLTLTTYGALTVVGGAIVAILEWDNPATFGRLEPMGRFLATVLHGVNARSLGISNVDFSEATQATWFIDDIMMFIGGGSASTGGGIKVTTFAVMVLAILAEIRGDRDIEVFGRRIGPSTVRLAVAVVALGAVIVGAATTIMLEITGLPLSEVLLEVISAFGTVGLSTGITANLPDSAKILLSLLMFTGRLGTMTFGAALAMRTRRKVVRFPEEAPSIG